MPSGVLAWPPPDCLWPLDRGVPQGTEGEALCRAGGGGVDRRRAQADARLSLLVGGLSAGEY